MHQRQTFHLHKQSEQQFGYAQAIRVGDRVLVSGATSLDEHLRIRCPNDLHGQIEIVYSNLSDALKSFGIGFAHVLKETIFTTDMDALLAANELRKSFFLPGHLPATTAVQVSQLVFQGLMVEVELEASVLVDAETQQRVLGNEDHDG